jgi:hypothetical protein
MFERDHDLYFIKENRVEFRALETPFVSERVVLTIGRVDKKLNL